jgi:hypothetical protein
MPLDAIAAGVPKRRSPRSHAAAQEQTAPDFATQMANILRYLKATLELTQQQQIAESNKHWREHPFQSGDEVQLSTKDLPITYATDEDNHRKALHHKWIGPFTLGDRRGENAFHVELPENWDLRKTHNVSRLKPSTIDHS